MIMLPHTPTVYVNTVTPTFYKNKKICANRSAYKIIVLVKNFPKINLA
jgi:hypothetical protein